ncbi:hypothetical protein Tco_0025418 [Tanacetum coccineum]
MHNNIMAAESKDRPPMLATGRYAQWRSRIGDEIYSTVDACQTANEMWIAIERWRVNPEWSRFMTVVKQTEKLDTVSYHKLFDIRKQYQPEVNEIRTERIAKTANPLARVASAQTYPDNYHQAPKPQRAYAPAPLHAST